MDTAINLKIIDFSLASVLILQPYCLQLEGKLLHLARQCLLILLHAKKAEDHSQRVPQHLYRGVVFSRACLLPRKPLRGATARAVSKAPPRRISADSIAL